MQELCCTDVAQVLHDGGVIAYPTEAVYGLGCDPDNDTAIHKLLEIKNRSWKKGLILVAADLNQLMSYIDLSALTQTQLSDVEQKWPGPFTFVMPTFKHISPLLRGEFDTIAVRVSAHKGVQEICRAFGKPLVSTSANLASMPPAMSHLDVVNELGAKLDALVIGELGQERQPSTIIDARTGKILRQG